MDRVMYVYFVSGHFQAQVNDPSLSEPLVYNAPFEEVVRRHCPVTDDAGREELLASVKAGIRLELKQSGAEDHMVTEVMVRQLSFLHRIMVDEGGTPARVLTC